MTGDDFINLLADVLLVLPVVGLLSTAFLWSVWYRDDGRPRSWVLFHMAAGATIATFVSFAIASLAIARLTGTSLGTPGGVVLALAVLILELIPLWYAIAVYLRQRGFKPPFPPFRG